MSEGRLAGIVLPGLRNNKTSQYIGDSSFMVEEEKKYVDEHVRILKVFSEALGMEIHWRKALRLPD